jgi:hypothetical protein
MRSAVALDDVVLIYLHIPKCGGTTLNSILANNFPERERFYVDPHDIKGSREKLKETSESGRMSIRLLHGHLSFGWHELLPRDALYFTMIRHPVDRIISHYNYVRFRHNHSHYLREIVEREAMSIADYVRSGICDELNNGMVRLLAGVEDIVQAPYGESRIPYGMNAPQLLDQALANIEKFFLAVGIQDQYDKSLLVFKAKLGLRDITYEGKNVGSKHYEKQSPTADDIDAILEFNQLDLTLFETIRDRFERDFAKLRFPLWQLTLFRTENWVRSVQSEGTRGRAIIRVLRKVGKLCCQ